jgi:hypothetical protein
MSTEVLEQAVNDLQRRVAELERTLAGKVRGGWAAIAGQAKDDDLFEEAMKLGAEWRTHASAGGH